MLRLYIFGNRWGHYRAHGERGCGPVCEGYLRQYFARRATGLCDPGRQLGQMLGVQCLRPTGPRTPNRFGITGCHPHRPRCWTVPKIHRYGPGFYLRGPRQQHPQMLGLRRTWATRRYHLGGLPHPAQHAYRLSLDIGEEKRSKGNERQPYVLRLQMVGILNEGLQF